MQTVEPVKKEEKKGKKGGEKMEMSAEVVLLYPS